MESARHYCVLFFYFFFFADGGSGVVTQLMEVVLLPFSRHKLPEVSCVEILLQN